MHKIKASSAQELFPVLKRPFVCWDPAGVSLMQGEPLICSQAHGSRPSLHGDPTQELSVETQGECGAVARASGCLAIKLLSPVSLRAGEVNAIRLWSREGETIIYIYGAGEGDRIESLSVSNRNPCYLTDHEKNSPSLP